MRIKSTLIFIILACVFILFLNGQEKKETVNLLSLQEGTFPVITPPTYSSWPVEGLLDESPESGWACEEGHIKDNVFVFEMVNPAVLERFEFDNTAVDTEGAGAKDITVELSAKSKDAGFETVLKASLADKKDRQKFNAAKLISARWVRLAIHSNHGSDSWTELLSFRGYGVKPVIAAPLENISGTYDTDYSKFHVRQQGTALVGCYEYSEGLLDGLIEGRVMKITWREGANTGPAVMVFSPDGKSFRGYWWHKGQEKLSPAGNWDGKKIGSQVGGCPHWAGSLGGELKKQLSNQGRVRVYGILFDLNSSAIRPESKPVLDEVLKMLQGEPSWKLTIEGHTDSTGDAVFNQTLSLQRAESVKAYLVSCGIGADKLQTKGYGSSKPVADNASELGRAQNRRVELVRQ
jgi:outer membrane protein OmpA-like peptidoglycan-associated protein